MTDPEVERAAGAIKDILVIWSLNGSEWPSDAADDIIAATITPLLGTIEALAADNARLRARLKPFADAADDLDDARRDGSEIWETSAAMSITAGGLRGANRAVQERVSVSASKRASLVAKAGELWRAMALPKNPEHAGFMNDEMDKIFAALAAIKEPKA